MITISLNGLFNDTNVLNIVIEKKCRLILPNRVKFYSYHSFLLSRLKSLYNTIEFFYTMPHNYSNRNGIITNKV